MYRKKLFIVCYGGGHVNIIKKLYGKLNKKFDVSILPLTTAKHFLEMNGIPYKDLKFYYDTIPEEDDILGIGKEFINEFNIDIEKIGSEDSFLYYGYNVRDYINIFGKENLKKNYLNEGRLTFLPLITMEKILKYEKPDIVLTTYSPRFERAALLVSKRLGIPNISIDGLHGLSRLINNYEREKGNIYYGDNIFVVNEFAKNNILKLNIYPANIYITGNPAFELKLSDFEIKKSNKDKDKINILYLTTELPKKLEILEKIIEYLNNSDIRHELIVKTHPSEKKEDYQNYLSNIKIESYDLYGSIVNADIVISNCSTASIEAAYLDKDVINLTMNISESFLSFFKNLNITFFADNYSELNKLLTEIIFEKKKSSIRLNRKVNTNLGSIERIVNIIESKLETRQ